MNDTFRIADLSDERDQEQVVSLLSSFSLESSHPQPLPEEIRDTICANLREFPVTLVYFVEHQDIPIGIAVCFLGFSTFQNAHVMNIHDFYIQKEHQGTGVGKRFLDFIEHQARNHGCCKVTLEVYQKNVRANIFFENHGYSGGRKVTPENIVYALSKSLR